MAHAFDRPGMKTPHYEIEGESVPLDHPFRLYGVWLRAVRVSPPGYADLRLLRSHALDGGLIVAATTGLPPDVIGAIRWPDMEKLLEASLAVLPDDFRAAIEGAELDELSSDQPEAPGAAAAVSEYPEPEDFAMSEKDLSVLALNEDDVDLLGPNMNEPQI